MKLKATLPPFFFVGVKIEDFEKDGAGEDF